MASPNKGGKEDEFINGDGEVLKNKLIKDGPDVGDQVEEVEHTGTLCDGTKFDSSCQFKFTVGQDHYIGTLLNMDGNKFDPSKFDPSSEFTVTSGQGLVLPLLAKIDRFSTGPQFAEPSLPLDEKRFCLYDWGTAFLVIPVSVGTTPKEFRNLSLSRDHIPDAEIDPVVHDEVNRGTSLVSVGSMVYCIGGCKLDKEEEDIPTNEVTKFDTNQPNPKLESCCNMIFPRVRPAVVGIGGKIYVFGGVSADVKEFPYGEFLDTNKPEHQQEWKALKEPVCRLRYPYAFHYEAETIYISSRSDQGHVIYDVSNGSSTKFDSRSVLDGINHVTVSGDKTIYWIDGMFFRAYEPDNGVYYLAYMDEVYPNFERRYTNATHGPVLVHLKDDLFNIFTLQGIGCPRNRLGIVECTKIRVTKCAGETMLQLERVGYQSYRCDPLWCLMTVLSL